MAYPEMIERFIAFQSSLGHSNGTMGAYKDTLNEFFLEYLNQKPLELVTTEDVHLFKSWKERNAQRRKATGISGQGAGAFLKGSSIAPTTMNRHFAAIKGFLTFYDKANLAKTVRIMKVQKKFDIIDFEDIKKIFNLELLRKYYYDKSKTKNVERLAFYSERLKLLIDFVVSSGLRLEETFVLTKSDLKIDRARPFIKVTGKGEKYREVELSSTWLAQYQEFLRKYPKSARGHKIFTNYNGGELSYSTLKTYIKTIGYALNIKGLSFHKLRHCFAILRYEKDHDIVALSKALGHDSIQTTMIYLSKVSTRSGPVIDVLESTR